MGGAEEAQPDAATILAALVATFPEFDARWRSADNLFREDDGSFTPCGVYCAFSEFYSERWSTFSAGQFVELGRFVTRCMLVAHSTADEAAATCFLENIAAEPCERPLAPHLGESGREYLRTWGGLQGD